MPNTILDSLPPLVDRGDFEWVKREVARGTEKVVVLDDDPTGTQTMHAVDVLAEWSVPSLEAALRGPGPCFYILTNTRSLPVNEASARCLNVVRNLAAAGSSTGVPFSIVSRSDSTLRGHYEAELGAIQEGLGQPADVCVVIPAFFEGGRYTIGDVHYVQEGERLVPVAETEFARDVAFGFTHSNLRDWIEEKTLGRTPAYLVSSVTLDTLRAPRGAETVARQLSELPKGSSVIVNAAAYGDLEVFVHGLLLAEQSGLRCVFRTAASFVRIRSGVEPKKILDVEEVLGKGPQGGLIVVGSYVSRSSAQLERLVALPATRAIEVVVDRLAEPVGRAREVERAAAEASSVMASGANAVLFTSRSREGVLGVAGDLGAGRIVSEALVSIVRSIPSRPRFLVAKGGITSCDVAIRGLGMRRARVLGQAAPGVPVWEMGPETRFPGLRYVVWPGNVGGPDALRDLVRHS